jgi:CRISPR-associated protein Csx17
MPKLAGCNPYPLSSYLKALSVLRLIVEHRKDISAKGYWLDDCFIINTQISENELVDFFLHEYQPTPLIAPWNGSTGFYPKDNKKTIDTIRKSTASRLAIYRETVETAQMIVEKLQLTVQPKDEDKRYLLEQLRNDLPDKAVKWIDTCALISDKNLKFPPLAGTGGNDGNFEFSRTFMQQLQELIDFKTGKPKDNAKLMLRAALFNDVVPGLQFSGKIGQFNPIAAGGANAAPGYDADSRVNPWDFILMLEGMMLFTSSATRRYESQETGDFAYPFTVRPSSIGYGSATDGDDARAELWIPLWTAPTGLKELQSVFNEGKTKVRGKTARDGIDFARAISSQGVQRGIDEFIRYSFQVRNGLSYFAIPLGRFKPKLKSQVDRLTELDWWLNKFRQAADDAKAPGTIKQAKRILETTLFEFSLGKKQLLDVLIVLGEVEATLSNSQKFVKDKFLPPLQLLNSSWIDDCDDKSIEFRLALALASRNLRPRLGNVRCKDGKWQWAENDDGVTTWQVGSLTNNLINWLQREEIETQQQTIESYVQFAKIGSWRFRFARSDEVSKWIWGKVDDSRIEKIARGLSLVNIPRKSKFLQKNQTPKLDTTQVKIINQNFPSPIPVAFAIVKITHHRILNPKILKKVFPNSQFTQDELLPRVPAMLRKLAVGDCTPAVNLALQRLRASGLNPAITEGIIYESPEITQRIAAALAFPLSDWDISRLLKQIRKIDEQEKYSRLPDCKV